MQIWIAPRTTNTPPSLQLKQPEAAISKNEWLCKISPEGKKDSIIVKQDAWLYQGTFDKGVISYKLQKAGDGVMLYILEGKIKVGDIIAGKEDTLFITDDEILKWISKKRSQWF